MTSSLPGLTLLPPGPLPFPVQALFAGDQPAELRLWGVLDRLLPGQVWTDDPAQPTWSIVREALFGTLYLGGRPPAAALARLLAELRRETDVLYGYWLETAGDLASHGGLTADSMPDGMQPDYQGRVLDFDQRQPISPGVLPAGCVLRPLDADLFDRCYERGLLLETYGSKQQALAQSFSLCLLDESGQLLCEAHAGPVIRGWIELGVVTHPQQRGKGYATLTCTALAQQCEAAGLQTYWNCAAQNRASAALARRLGYRREREYALRAWYRLRRAGRG